MDDQKDLERLLWGDSDPPTLPRYLERVKYDVPPRLNAVSAGGYILEHLLYEASPLLPVLGEALSFAGYWQQNEELEVASEEQGILLIDRFTRVVPGQTEQGTRLYLRREGYALLWRDCWTWKGRQEWRSVLRPIKIHDAVAAVGGIRPIVGMLASLQSQFAALSTHPTHAKRACRLAYYCRLVAKEAAAEGW